MAFPALFATAGYKTAGYGKIFHWDGNEKNIWNHDQWDGDWYDYQGKENGYMNSSTMADKIKPEEQFRDHEFASRAIHTMRTLHSQDETFMVGVGFKLPHLAVHVPFKYFDMYRQRRQMWKRRKRELRFPPSAPVVAHKCCALGDFQFMNNDGGEKSVKSTRLGVVDQPFTQQMHTELVGRRLSYYGCPYLLTGFFPMPCTELGVCGGGDLPGRTGWPAVGCH